MIRRISTIEGKAWTLTDYCAVCGEPIWTMADDTGVGTPRTRASCNHTMTTPHATTTTSTSTSTSTSTPRPRMRMRSAWTDPDPGDTDTAEDTNDGTGIV